MDLQGYVHMSIIKNGKTYEFITPLGSTYKECLEAAQEIVREITLLVEQKESV